MKKSGQIRQLLISLMPIQALAVGMPAINSLLNSFIIGHFLGSEALAAMGFILPLDMAIVVISLVLSVGGQVISGNCLGRGDRESLNRIFNTTSAAAVFFGAVITAAALAVPETVAGLLGARDEVLPLTVDYIRGIAPGYVFTILFACLLPFIQLERASGFSTASVTAVLVVNSGGNLLNAVVLHGGTFGSGLATAAANFAAVIVCLIYFLFKSSLFKLSPKRFDLGVFRDILLHGYPAGVPQICGAIKSGLLCNFLFALGGTPALAAMTIANNINNGIGCMVEGGYSGSLNLISSVLVGERDVESLRELPKQGFVTAYPIYVLAYLLVFFLAKPFALLCGAEPELIGMYVTIICLINLWYFTNPVKAMSVALYQAFNRHKFLSFFQVMNCLVFPALCMIAGRYLFDSVEVVALCNLFAETCSCITLAVYYYTRRKRLPGSLFKLTDIPNTLALPSAERYNRTLRRIEDVSEASEGLIGFCREKGLSPRESKFCGLCVEELSAVALQNNLERQKNFSIDLRVLHDSEEDGIAIMLRDNGQHFDPKEWLDLYANEDPMRCIGVKYVVGKAKDVRYTSTLGLNVVVIRV